MEMGWRDQRIEEWSTEISVSHRSWQCRRNVKKDTFQEVHWFGEDDRVPRIMAREKERGGASQKKARS